MSEPVARKENCLTCGSLDKRGTGKLKDGSKCPNCNGLGFTIYVPRTERFEMLPENFEAAGGE